MARSSKSMLKNLITSFLWPAIALTSLAVFCITFSILYATTQDTVFLILLIVFTVVIVAVFGIVSFFAIRSLYNTYYEGLFKVSKNNLHAFYSGSTKIKKYPGTRIDEIDLLNNEVESLQIQFKDATLVTSSVDYSSIPFEYVPGFEDLITLKSFKIHLSNIIFFSNTYRNCLMNIFYPETVESLEDKEIEATLFLLKIAFKDYKNILFIIDEHRKSFYVYLPMIDTFSRIQEQLTNILQNTSVVRETSEGVSTISARVAIVAYPYSDVDEMLHDINYARNSDEEIHIYLPQRVEGLNENSIMKDSMNLNIASKAMESLGRLENNLKDLKGYTKIIKNAIETLSKYLGIDEAGIIGFNHNTADFYSALDITTSKVSLLKEGNIIDASFVHALADAQDIDKTYYFSTRNHANSSLGRYLDKYRISSGFYYVITNRNGLAGIIYFFNKEKDFYINSYLRETLVLFTGRISDFLLTAQRELSVSKAFDDIECMLKLTNFFTYRVDRQTYEIHSFSAGADTIYPDIATGKLCYRALYGLDRPCANCPLSTMKKMVTKYRGATLETSLNLVTDKHARLARMLVKDCHKEDDITFDRFNKDLLINSYPSLVEEMKNYFAGKIKGYLLLLRIDNLEDLVVNYGSEGTLVGLRAFIKEIKSRNAEIQNVYYFNAQTIAILYAEQGQIDLVNKCEGIYDLSKENYFDNENGSTLNITYLPMIFPSGYPTAYDFLKNAQRFFDSGEYEINKDFIYFEENNYSRSASRNEFMLTVIDDKFGNSTFTALLQPYVRASDRSVYGVEMLLRLSDDYRNIIFNADELIKVAVANGKMKLISDALINYTGNLYQKQGSSIFKVFGLKRFSINIDYSYFTNEESIDNLTSLVEFYNFPKDFIAFEIAEWDIKNHYGEYKAIAEILKKHNITLVCDQYSGRSMTLAKLKEIGFNEIKIARGIVGFIDSDPQKKAAITSIIEGAKELGITVSVVGVENHEQYDIVRNLDNEAMLQGYYFYKPLDKNALIGALRSANANRKD